MYEICGSYSISVLGGIFGRKFYVQTCGYVSFYLKCFNDDNNCFVNVCNINLEKKLLKGFSNIYLILSKFKAII